MRVLDHKISKELFFGFPCLEENTFDPGEPPKLAIYGLNGQAWKKNNDTIAYMSTLPDGTERVRTVPSSNIEDLARSLRVPRKASDQYRIYLSKWAFRSTSL